MYLLHHHRYAQFQPFGAVVRFGVAGRKGRRDTAD